MQRRTNTVRNPVWPGRKAAGHRPVRTWNTGVGPAGDSLIIRRVPARAVAAIIIADQVLAVADRDVVWRLSIGRWSLGVVLDRAGRRLATVGQRTAVDEVRLPIDRATAERLAPGGQDGEWVPPRLRAVK